MTGSEEHTLLTEYWAPRARRTEAVHYRIATIYARFHDVLSLAIVVFSAVTASTLFANLSSTNASLKIAVATLSVVAAVLTGIDRSVGYAKRSEAHRRAGSDWCPIVNKTEEIIVQLPAHPVTDDQIQSLETAMAETTNKSPYIPEHYFRKYGLAETYLVPMPRRRRRLRLEWRQ